MLAFNSEIQFRIEQYTGNFGSVLPADLNSENPRVIGILIGVTGRPMRSEEEGSLYILTRRGCHREILMNLYRKNMFVLFAVS